MKMRRVGTGPGIGYKSFRQLMIFKDRSLLDQFRTLGADVGASADATMKIGDKGVALAPNVSFNPLLSVYQITDRGVLLQANWALLHTSRTLASTRDRSGPCTQHCRVGMGTDRARRVLDKVPPKHDDGILQARTIAAH